MDLFLVLLWGFLAAALFFLSYTDSTGPMSPVWSAARWAALVLALFNLVRWGARRLLVPRRRLPRPTPPRPEVRPDDETPRAD